MALWQYQFTIIPNHYILKDISNEEFEYELWEYANMHKEDFMQVNSFLPKTKSWSEYLDIYGNIDSNCLEVIIKQSVQYEKYNRLAYLANKK